MVGMPRPRSMLRRGVRAGLALAIAFLAASSTPQAAPTPAARERHVRPPAAAGRFYPADAAELRRVVGDLMSAEPVPKKPSARMILVPHAGLEYSGAIAAAAFRQLEPGWRRAFIIAGNHTGEARYVGAAVDRATHYGVPGLEVPVADAARTLLTRPGFVDVPAAHGMHMIEIELPFLAALRRDPFEIVPIIVGALSLEQAQSLAGELLHFADETTRFVISVDLSHFHPYDVAVRKDRACLDALAQSDTDAIVACDTDATQVLLLMHALGTRNAWTPRLLDYRNSGDVIRDRSSVVGYGALVYEPTFVLSRVEKEALLRLARQSIEARLFGRSTEPPPELLRRLPRLGLERATFVTLTKNGALRGCIGSLKATDPLVADLIANAGRAALEDPRFAPVTAEELKTLELSISVLDTPRPLVASGAALLSRLAADRPGLVLEYRGRRSTFLPQVWDELKDPAEFLAHLCAKQGSPDDCWRDANTKFSAYGAQVFHE